MNLPDHGLIVASVLFVTGLAGFLARRNMVFMLISAEVMLNSAGLAFISAGARHGQPDGQVMTLFIFTMAAAELAVGLVIVQKLYQRFQTLDTEQFASAHPKSDQ